MRDFRKDVFVNPYNFIKLPKKKAKAYGDTDKHSGVIHYTVTTRTPLFIPNSSQDEAFDVKGTNGVSHKSYDFFSYTDLSGDEKKCKNNSNFYEPVIPGSEMRGVIRNVYETLTDSCMGLLNDVYPVKRIGAPFNPGLLKKDKNGKFSLVKAKSYRIGENFPDKIEKKMDRKEKEKILKKNIKKSRTKFEKYDNGQIFYFNSPKNNEIVENYTTEKGKDYSNSGYLIKWGFGVLKQHYHVFEKCDEIIREGFTKDKIKKSVDDLIESYLEQRPNELEEKEYKEYKKAIEKFLNDEKDTEDFFPINYYNLETNNLVYLAPATFSKEVSNSSLIQLANEFAPCMTGCCPACDLFGKVGENAKGSRIRFSDLVISKKENNNSEYYYDIVTIPNLSSPKLGNVDFYLKRPDNAKYWTYDYYVLGNRIVEEQAKIRGRKYYWHHRNSDISKANPSNQNKTIRPLKENVSFKGCLYFDGISNKQLNQLIYILNTEKEGLGYKLGMGKPLGLGSISCKVDLVETRKISINIDGELEYTVVQQKSFNNLSYKKVGFSNEVENEFKKITSFDTVPANVEICYPKTFSHNDKGFEWFQANHKATTVPKERKMMKIQYSLPNILGEIELPRLAELPSGKQNKTSTNNFEKNNNGNKNVHYQNSNNKQGKKKNNKHANKNQRNPR